MTQLIIFSLFCFLFLILCFSTTSNLKMRKFFKKIKTAFERLNLQLYRFWQCQIIEGVYAKNLKATLLFIIFFKVFDSIHREKMEQILLAYAHSKETAIMILYKNMKAMIHSPDGDTDFSDLPSLLGLKNTQTTPLQRGLTPPPTSFLDMTLNNLIVRFQ